MASITQLLLSQDEPVRVNRADSLVPLRLPWYRSLPLSAIEHLSVTVGEEIFADDQLSLVIGENEYPFATMNACDEFWFVQDTAWARVPRPVAGDTVELHVEASVRIPYLMITADHALVRSVSTDRIAPTRMEA